MVFTNLSDALARDFLEEAEDDELPPRRAAACARDPGSQEDLEDLLAHEAGDNLVLADSAKPPSTRQLVSKAMFIGAPLLATAAGAIAWLSSASVISWPRLQRPISKDKVLGLRCEEPEIDVDYWTVTNLAVLEGVTSSDACLSRCNEEENCGAWTWGASDGEQLLRGVCFLKPTGLSPDKHLKTGLVSGRPCRGYQTAKAADMEHDTKFQAITDCQHTEDDTDLIGSELILGPVPEVRSATSCRAVCEGEARCGAWSWGKARDTRWLTDFCFLKEANDLGKLVRLAKKGVVTGFPCRGPQASLAAPSAEEAGDDQRGTWEMLTDCREQQAGVDYWTEGNLLIEDNVKSSAECNDICKGNQGAQ